MQESRQRLSADAGPRGTSRRGALAVLAALLAARPWPASADELREAPPHYATRVPPAATLRYALRRGALFGSGRIDWRPVEQGYELRLEGSVLGLDVLTQVSRGRLDGHGLAPLRFTDQRIRRPLYVAQFDRDRARISFVDHEQTYPLWPGVQDRLSWMIQLAAIASADPQRVAAGATIELQVVGARGDASVWRFRSRGTAGVDTPSGHVEALHLMREPREPDDTRVDVWLDPARHWLPVRATLREGDGTLELTLREMQPGG